MQPLTVDENRAPWRGISDVCLVSLNYGKLRCFHLCLLKVITFPQLEDGARVMREPGEAGHMSNAAFNNGNDNKNNTVH